MGCTDLEEAMSKEESVILLLKQCRDMRRQEILFRVATLLLFCFFTTVALFSRITDFRCCTQQNEAKMCLNQERTATGAENGTSIANRKMHIQLTQDLSQTSPCTQCIPWQLHFNVGITYENNSVMIHETGVYFVYAKFRLQCENKVIPFSMKVRRWSKSYQNVTFPIEENWTINCGGGGIQTVFMGELLDLVNGDQLKVWIGQGFEQIDTSTFGAFSQ